MNQKLRVTVVDRAMMARLWSQPGLYRVITRSVEINARCPTCGGLRGKPYKRRFIEDGYSYTVDCWTNPCEHVDLYPQVLREARMGAEVRQIT